jgi:hypothetical protein
METKNKFAEQMRYGAPETDALFSSKASVMDQGYYDPEILYDLDDTEAYEDGACDSAEGCACPGDGGSVASMIYSMVATILMMFLIIKKRKDDEERIRRF